MRFIPTRIHGILDYLGGLLLIASPWLFGFYAEGAETWVPVVIGVAMIGMAALTNYEMGVIRTIPMTTHLGMDGIAGVLLMVSPWLFGFAEHVWMPHFILGLLELGAAITTETEPEHGHIGGSPTLTS